MPQTWFGRLEGPLVYRIDAAAIQRLVPALTDLSRSQKNKVIPRALNRVGDMAFTQVKRILAKETGAKVGRVAKALSKIRASYGTHDYEIRARDEFMTLKDFGPRQGKKGVSAAPWHKRRVFAHTFIGPNRHVFKRLTAARKPIEKLWGPAIPREMMRGKTEQYVNEVAATHLVPRILYETEREIARVKATHGL